MVTNPISLLINTTDLISLDCETVIFDCRFDLMNPELGKQEYDAEHIEGAVYVNLDEVMSSPITATSGRHPLPSRESFAEFLSACGVGENTQLIAYDNSAGLFAARFWWMCRWIGHESVAILDGGINAWKQQGGRVTTETPALKSRSSLPVKESLEAVVDVKAVINASQHQDRLIADVRAAERYRGEVEPIDPIAGHVPNAINIPLSENYDSEGQFLSADQLRTLYRSKLGEYKAKDPILMCGSGVTACLSRFCVELAGLPPVSVYPGSWSEWIRDPSRGVATGE
jgi:thiosulfate/3-mercaptopyruvate sulfurtransferase